MKADDGKLCNSILAVGIPVLRAVHVICPAPPPPPSARRKGVSELMRAKQLTSPDNGGKRI